MISPSDWKTFFIGIVIGVIVGMLTVGLYINLVAKPYGDATTENAGYTWVCLGFETRGDPGFFNACSDD